MIGNESPATARSEEREQAMLKAANALKAALRRHDFIARMGPNQFAVIAVQSNSEGVSRIRKLIASTFAQAGLRANIGAASRQAGTGLKHAWQIATKEMLHGKAATS